MNQAPANSFMKFVLGFLVFISVSFGVTFAVNTYSASQTASAQQATALSAMLKTK